MKRRRPRRAVRRIRQAVTGPSKATRQRGGGARRAITWCDESQVDGTSERCPCRRRRGLGQFLADVGAFCGGLAMLMNPDVIQLLVAAMTARH